MAKSIPITRKIAWVSVIPHLAVGGTLMLAIHWIVRPGEPRESVVLGTVAYFVVSRVLRGVLLRDNNRGTAHLLSGRFAEMIPCFERSYAFFSRYPWLDRWRYLLVLSSSAATFREMALCNIAFAHVNLGNNEVAVQFYERALAEFPGCIVAAHSLKRWRDLQKTS